MRSATHPYRRLLVPMLSLTYITIGLLSSLPGASLLRLASNTHVSLEVAGTMFALAAFGSLLSTLLSGILLRYLQPKYLLLIGLFLLGSGSTTIVLTSSFAVLLGGQILIGLAFGFIDPSLNTIATLTFSERLASFLNAFHGLFGLGSLFGPLLLAVGLSFFNSLMFAYFTGVGVAALVFVLIFVQQFSSPPKLPATNMAPKETAHRALRTVFSQKSLWLLVLQVSLFAAAEIGFGNWIVTAVSQSATLSLAQAAPVATAFFLGLMLGRFGSAQVHRRGWMSESALLYAVLCGSVVCGFIVALFSDQVFVSYVASTLVGCFLGPLEPGVMALASRRFAHVIGSISSLLILSTNVTAMLVPTVMGLLIPALGMRWVIAIPALCCAVAALPMVLVNRMQPGTPGASYDR